MAKKLPLFDYNICVACGLCDQACPISVITSTLRSDNGYKRIYPTLPPQSKCTGCSICQKVCPVDAIEMKEVAAI